MLQQLLYIGCGGFLGAVSRFFTTNFVNHTFSQSLIPLGTFVVNMIGCFFIGYLNGMFTARNILSPEIRLMIFVGFLGSFTTFSTFGFDTFLLTSERNILYGTLNVAAHLLVGLPLVWLGIALSRQ
ncbi:MAG: fluoride efflux transporter CrcB [Proteobacteria bacterium]|nr:fluoride efflux transporter CrcB [Pseudomonadota bacterium]